MLVEHRNYSHCPPIVPQFEKNGQFWTIPWRKKKPRNRCGYGAFALEPIARLELATCWLQMEESAFYRFLRVCFWCSNCRHLLAWRKQMFLLILIGFWVNSYQIVTSSDLLILLWLQKILSLFHNKKLSQMKKTSVIERQSWDKNMLNHWQMIPS